MNIKCQDAITYFSKLTFGSLDADKRCSAIFLNISKAFDVISHKLLLLKLKSIIGHNAC